MSLQLTAQNYDDSKIRKQGLVNGGHVVLTCAICKACLIDIIITRPDADITTKGRATCPYCKKMSFIKEWKGLYSVAGIFASPDGTLSLPELGKEEDTGIPMTALENISEDGDVSIFHVVKASNGEPIYE